MDLNSDRFKQAPTAYADEEADAPDWAARQADREKLAERLLTDIFPCGDVTEDAAQALFFILELAIFEDAESQNLAEELRRRLFYGATFGDKMIHKFAGRVVERYLGKAA